MPNKILNPAEREQVKGEVDVNLNDRLSEAGYSDPESLKDCFDDEHLLGVGTNSMVYDIAGTEYVVSVLKGVALRRSHPINLDEIELLEDPLYDLNVGQPVAKCGEATILKKQYGIPAGSPKGVDAVTKVSGYRDHLARTAEMPQESFDTLARTLVTLNQRGYNTDPSRSSNLLVDASNQQFGLVDVTKSNENSPMRDTLSGMASLLMDPGYANWKEYDELIPEFVNLRQTILLKAVQAAKNAGLPFYKEGNPAGGLEFAFKIAGLKGRMEEYLEV